MPYSRLSLPSYLTLTLTCILCMSIRICIPKELKDNPIKIAKRQLASSPEPAINSMLSMRFPFPNAKGIQNRYKL